MYDFVLLLTFNLINILNYISEIHFTALLHHAYMQDHVSIINFNGLLLWFSNLRDMSKLLSQSMMAISFSLCSMTTREGNMCSLLQIQSSYGVYLIPSPRISIGLHILFKMVNKNSRWWVTVDLFQSGIGVVLHVGSIP